MKYMYLPFAAIAVVIFEYFRPKFGKICKKVFLKIKATQQHPHLFLKQKCAGGGPLEIEIKFLKKNIMYLEVFA